MLHSENKPMTVGELKEALADFDDNAPIQVVDVLYDVCGEEIYNVYEEGCGVFLCTQPDEESSVYFVTD